MTRRTEYVPHDLRARGSEASRRRAMAEAIMMQGMQPQRTQMAGRVAIPVSPLTAIANVATAAMGSHMDREAGKELDAVDQEISYRQSEAQQRLAEALASGDTGQVVSAMSDGDPRAMAEMAKAMVTRKPTVVDTNDKKILIDGLGNREEMAVGVSPNTALTQQETTARQRAQLAQDMVKFRGVSGNTVYANNQANQRHQTTSGSTVYANQEANKRFNETQNRLYNNAPVGADGGINEAYVQAQAAKKAATAKDGDMPANFGELPPPDQVEAAVDKAVKHIGGWSQIGENMTQFGAIAGMGTNPERDFQRGKINNLTATIAAINKIPGARSNYALELALKGVPKMGVFSNAEKAQVDMREVMKNVRTAHDFAQKTYNDPNAPKTTRKAAYEQLRGIEEMLNNLVRDDRKPPSKFGAMVAQ